MIVPDLDPVQDHDQEVVQLQDAEEDALAQGGEVEEDQEVLHQEEGVDQEVAPLEEAVDHVVHRPDAANVHQLRNQLKLMLTC